MRGEAEGILSPRLRVAVLVGRMKVAPTKAEEEDEEQTACASEMQRGFSGHGSCPRRCKPSHVASRFSPSPQPLCAIICPCPCWPRQRWPCAWPCPAPAAPPPFADSTSPSLA